MGASTWSEEPSTSISTAKGIFRQTRTTCFWSQLGGIMAKSSAVVLATHGLVDEKLSEITSEGPVVVWFHLDAGRLVLRHDYSLKPRHRHRL
jgi:hypothetical protein